MTKLADFELNRAGNLVTIQWRGSPRFSIGVLSTLTEAQAFERAASSLESGGIRPGFTLPDIEACVVEIRKRAAVKV